MATISESLAVAIQHHLAGRLSEASSIYRQILAVDPDQHDAWHLLGVVAWKEGRFPEAVECIRRALAYKPDWAEAHYNLANAWRGQGVPDEAAASYRRAIQLRPGFAEAHGNLGIALKDRGEPDEAEACYRRAIGLRPDYAEAHSNLGIILKERGRPDEAEACYRRAIQLRPDHAEAHNNLGIVLKERERLDEAEACFRRALRGKPDHAEILGNLGAVLRDQGKLVEAESCFRRALELAPDRAVEHINLGVIHQLQGQLDLAEARYRRAIQLRPDHADAHYNLGNVWMERGILFEAEADFRGAIALDPCHAQAHNNLGSVLRDQGRLDEAEMAYRRALELKDDYAEVYSNLGNTLKDRGRLDEALACYRRVLGLTPDDAAGHDTPDQVAKGRGKLDEAAASHPPASKPRPYLAQVHSNLLMTTQYRSGVTLSELAEIHAGYDRSHAEPLRASWTPHENDRDPHRRLRLGFVSPDFGRHPVGYFLIRALENLDPARCETFCYSDRRLGDDLTGRFQAAATTWREVSRLDDEGLAGQILADRVNVLFDLAGHTAHNRLLVFARKPAPIQVTWAGYTGTTGLAAMDYLLADRYQVPRGTEGHYRESVLRMPDGYVTYDPPGYAPTVGALPARERGFVTFGSFNNRAKITPRTVEIWAKILDRVPQSRLVLKYRGMDDASTARALAGEFAGHGIDPARLVCLGWSEHLDLLNEYNRIDLALDPHPYNGGLTTCEALWMGVPVVTCPGETFASRHSLGHLSNVGLTETIARTMDDYVELAVSLSRDLPRLAGLRAGLRERMAGSPLCDGKRFAEDLTFLVRQVWQGWCYEENAAGPYSWAR